MRIKRPWVPPRVIDGRYRLDKEVCRGGEAIVFRGSEIGGNREVAVKQRKHQPTDKGYQSARHRFSRLAGIHIPHPNILQNLNYIEQGTDQFLVMPWVRLGNLFDWCPGSRAPQGPQIGEGVRYVAAAAAGIAAMHQAGYVHLDVKPHNILLESDADSSKVIDFGLARPIDRSRQRDGFRGSMQFASPEHFLEPGREQAASDVFSLAATTFYCLTGKPPFGSGSEYQVATRICGEAPIDIQSANPGIAPTLIEACLAGLVKPPEARPSADTFAASLRQAVGLPPRHPGMQGQTSASTHYCLRCGHSQPVSSSKCRHCGGRFIARWVLLLRPTNLPNRRFRLPAGRYTLGRYQLGAELSGVSRRHLTADVTEHGISVCDAGSRNGTRVGDANAHAPSPLDTETTLNIAGHRGRLIEVASDSE